MAAVAGGAQLAVLCGLQPPGRLGGVAARAASLGDGQLFRMPALAVAGHHSRRRLEAFADRAAAFLRLAQGAAELV